MKITVIGCGNFSSYNSYNQSFLLEEGEQKLLLDCGTKIPTALHHHGVDIKSIDTIYVSHSHADHIGGLEEVAYLRYDWAHMPQKWWDSITFHPITLVGQKELLDNIWQRSLRGGLDTFNFEPSLNTFFSAMPVTEGFVWAGWKFQLIKELHAEGNNKYCYGLYATNAQQSDSAFPTPPEHKSVYFTLDSRFDSSVERMDLYHKSDLIFQDCECTAFPSGVHANFTQLVLLPDKIKAKMWLSHYQDFVLLNDTSTSSTWTEKARDQFFAGFVSVGNTYEA